MTRDGTVGRSDATERSLTVRWDVDPVRMMRPRFADPIRASSVWAASTGRTHDCKRPLCGTPNYLLPGGGHPHMKRRKFITLLGGAAVAWPLAARAQQPEKMRRIAVLSNAVADSPDDRARLAVFRTSLEQLG